MEFRIAVEIERHKGKTEIIALNFDCCVTTRIVGLSEEFVNLKSLSLKAIGLTNLDGLPFLPKLDNLDISSNLISGELQTLSLLPNLKSLNLSHNKISNEKELLPLRVLESLEHLHLFGNPLTYNKEYFRTVCEILTGIEFLDSVPRDSKLHSRNSTLKKVAVIGGIAVGSGIVAVAAAPIVASAVGVTAAGIAVGTTFAAFGGGGAGVVGLAAATNVAIGVSAGAAGGGIAAGVSRLLKRKNKNVDSTDESKDIEKKKNILGNGGKTDQNSRNTTEDGKPTEDESDEDSWELL